jgi:hypothetical protein
MTTPRLTDQQLAELLGLIKGSDTVELKLTVPDTDIGSVRQALELDVLDGQIRQIVFFDTPDLTLNRSGVVVRARRIQGGRGDTVVKLRPVLPDQISRQMRTSPDFGVEVDAMPGGFVCSASMKGTTTAAAVQKVLVGSQPARDLFSKAQRAFYKAHAPEDLKLRDLSVLGPITILKLKFDAKDYARKMVAEMWMYPDGSRILELSTKCLPPEAFSVATETRVYLTQRGIDLSGEQQTKTKTALEYFASLHAQPRDGVDDHPDADTSPEEPV